MSHNRSGYGSDCSNLSLAIVKKSSLAGVHSPRSQTCPWPAKILDSPKSVVVSVTGEQIISPSEDVSNISTNPFAIEDQRIENFDSTSEEIVQQFLSKKQKHLSGQKRRRVGEIKERRRPAKIVLTQRNSARLRAHNIQRSIKSQTDVSMYNIKSSPECIGDGQVHYSYELGNSFVEKRDKKQMCLLAKQDKSSQKFFHLPESLKVLLSFILMIVLILLTVSELLNMNLVSGTFNTAVNYVRSFRLEFYERKPQTTSERILTYLTNIFE